MHLFQHRLEQLLNSVDGLSDGRRQRLSRPLRQADIRCWEASTDETIDAALLAATRTLAHELLDGLALHLEAALAACATWESRLLLAAVAARETVLGRQVRFQVDGRRLGCAFPSVSLLTLTPGRGMDAAGLHIEAEQFPSHGAAPARRLHLQIVCDDRPRSGNVRPETAVEVMLITPQEVRRDPFAVAARIGRAIAQGLGEWTAADQEQ